MLVGQHPRDRQIADVPAASIVECGTASDELFFNQAAIIGFHRTVELATPGTVEIM